MKIQFKELDSSSISRIQDLANEAYSKGFGFVQRAIDEWNSGVNRFSKLGEIFYGLFFADECIGIGGLSVDPYVNNSQIGRIRHVYISQSHRRKGFASKLLKKLINFGSTNFKTIRLYTDNPDACSFYESIGFTQFLGIRVSHIFNFTS